MQIKLPQLSNTLSKSLSHLYLFTGDEPLLVQEAQSQLRQESLKQGFELREIFTMDTHFDWNDLYMHTESGNLFTQKKLLDIRNPQAKFDTKAQKFLLHYLSRPNPDVIIVISCPKLSAAQKRTKWFKHINDNSVVVSIWPVSAPELPHWIGQRLKQADLKMNPTCIQMLARFTEGNLLATDQAITKLKLLCPNEELTPEKMVSVIHDNARFSIFDLGNYALAGNLEKTQRILQQLRLANTEPTLILWSLSREIRLLHATLHAINQGENISVLLRSEWASRQALLKKALRRLDIHTLKQLIKLSHRADYAIKGLHQDDVWVIFSQILLSLCTASPIQTEAIT